jgi:hypothetical protein
MKATLGVLVPAILTLAASVPAATLRVPRDFPTIQQAVDAAVPGDEIRVMSGRWCGATLTKRLELRGQGNATIVGCPAPAPALFGTLRIGFFLPDGLASGTTIRNFDFDGAGVSNANLDPLSFAVFARNADNVTLEQNGVVGTIQAITNTSGDGWSVMHNRIQDLTAFTCDGFCGGGDAIVFQERDTSAGRRTGNEASHNMIDGQIPDGLDEFSVVGIVVFGQDGLVASNNRFAIPDNPAAAGEGIGIEVSDVCCGNSTPFLTSINSVITNNEGRNSQFVLVVDRDASGGTGNTQGAVIERNRGVQRINGTVTTAARRAVSTPTRTLTPFE